MSLILCSECKVALKCSKNEVMVRMGGAELKYGDEYVCPVCGKRVIAGFGGSIMPGHPSYQLFEKSIDVEGTY